MSIKWTSNLRLQHYIVINQLVCTSKAYSNISSKEGVSFFYAILK